MTAGATKELRLSVDKKRKHILCRSRPHSGSSSSLQALLLSMVVDRTKECIVGCTKSPFSLPYKKKSTSNCSLFYFLGYIYPHCIAICHLSRVGIVFICPCSTREKVVNMLHNKCHHAKIRSNYSFSNAHKKQMEK